MRSPLRLLIVLAAMGWGALALGADLKVIDQTWVDSARQRDVPVRIHLPPGAGPHAVILFSHGLGGSRAGGARWGEVWAADGFITIHLQHPGSDEALWKDKRPLVGLLALRQGASVENALARGQDVKFALDEVARRKAAGDALLSGADLAHVGLAGHSFGAQTAMMMAGEGPADARLVDARLVDARIVAVIAMSPAARGPEAGHAERFGNIAIPVLCLTGTEDRAPLLNDVEPANRRLPWRYMRGPDKFMLVLSGADHMVFNGDPEGRKWSEANRVVHAPLIERVTLAFWNAYLRGDGVARSQLGQGAIASEVGDRGEWFAK